MCVCVYLYLSESISVIEILFCMLAKVCFVCQLEIILYVGESVFSFGESLFCMSPRLCFVCESIFLYKSLLVRVCFVCL